MTLSRTGAPVSHRRTISSRRDSEVAYPVVVPFDWDDECGLKPGESSAASSDDAGRRRPVSRKRQDGPHCRRSCRHSEARYQQETLHQAAVALHVRPARRLSPARMRAIWTRTSSPR